MITKFSMVSGINLASHMKIWNTNMTHLLIHLPTKKNLKKTQLSKSKTSTTDSMIFLWSQKHGRRVSTQQRITLIIKHSKLSLVVHIIKTKLHFHPKFRKSKEPKWKIRLRTHSILITTSQRRLWTKKRVSKTL